MMDPRDKDVEAYLTSPRRRSVVIDDEKPVEIPSNSGQNNVDISKLKPVQGRPPTPIPSDDEEDDEDDAARCLSPGDKMPTFSLPTETTASSDMPKKSCLAASSKCSASSHTDSNPSQ